MSAIDAAEEALLEAEQDAVAEAAAQIPSAASARRWRSTTATSAAAGTGGSAAEYSGISIDDLVVEYLGAGAEVVRGSAAFKRKAHWQADDAAGDDMGDEEDAGDDGNEAEFEEGDAEELSGPRYVDQWCHVIVYCRAFRHPLYLPQTGAQHELPGPHDERCDESQQADRRVAVQIR